MKPHDSPTSSLPQPHRRAFILTLAGASTVASQSAHPRDQDKPAPNRSETDARMDLILARYGPHLDDDARHSIRRDVDAVVRRANRLRVFELSNGDEPMPVFTPYRAPVT